jgi:CheY-like chemotaxis protein
MLSRMTRSILLIEDDADDALLIRQGLEAVGVGDAIRHVKDGEEALEYLKGTGPYSQRQLNPLPGLVLLDLHLPKLSGLEVLQWMRQQPAYKTTIVVVLTGQSLDSEVQRAYLSGANSLLVKDASQDQLDKKMRLLKEYWLGANKPAN